MDHQAHYSSYHKSIILTMTLFFIFPPLLFNTTYLIHVVTLRLWIDDPCMNGTMTLLNPDPRFGTVNPGRGTRQRPRIMWLWFRNIRPKPVNSWVFFKILACSNSRTSVFSGFGRLPGERRGGSLWPTRGCSCLPILRTMCGSRTGGWSLPCVMSGWQRCVDWFLAK
jgi:hypothetical protein